MPGFSFAQIEEKGRAMPRDNNHNSFSNPQEGPISPASPLHRVLTQIATAVVADVEKASTPQPGSASAHAAKVEEEGLQGMPLNET
jgi:hypothetical protein